MESDLIRCHSTGVTIATPNQINDPGPYYDDLNVGEHLQPAPALTLGAGEAAIYQALCGDPLPIALSQDSVEL